MSDAGDVLRCYFCDQPAGYSDDTEEDNGPLATYDSGAGSEWLHPRCYKEMLSNEGCGGDD